MTVLIKPEDRQRKRPRDGGVTVQIARAALATLMRQGLPPTPDNYSRAWRDACDAVLVRDPPARPETQGSPAVEAAKVAMDAVDALSGQAAARPVDAASAVAAPAGPNPELHDAERRSGELVRLVHTLCDVLASLSDDESWVSGQIQAVRRLVQGDIDRAALADLRVLLGDTARRQKSVREQRQRTVDHLKKSLVEMAGVIAGLNRSTDSFADRMAEHAAGIEGAPSLEALGDLVKGLLDDTRTMQVSVEESRQGIERSSEAAADLEKELARLEEQLATVSAEMLTDHLTRTMNRRGLDESFLSCHAESLAQGSPLSVALIDVDDFKRLNDALGHQAGDEALRHVADLLKAKLRPSDVVARYGGEEFVMVLPGAERAAAVKTIERLQRALTEHVFVHGANRTFITFSGGVTEVGVDDTLQSALKRADHAMYVAKRAGKNCVRTA
jgi:diguanylate cyclase